jgi:hypothetical protein
VEVEKSFSSIGSVVPEKDALERSQSGWLCDSNDVSGIGDEFSNNFYLRTCVTIRTKSRSLKNKRITRTFWLSNPLKMMNVAAVPLMRPNLGSSS